MAGRVTENWQRRSFTRGRSATRVFEVDAGPLNEGEAIAEVATQAGVTYGSTFPLDPALTIPSGGISVQIVTPGFYRVQCSYEGFATSGDTTALFSKKWQVLPIETVHEQLEADVDYGRRAVVNSAKLPNEYGLTRLFKYFRFRMRRYEAGTDLLAKNLEYGGKWNSDAVALPRIGNASPMQLKLISITQVEMQEQGASTGVLVEYLIEARKPRMVAYNGGAPVEIHGWHRRIMDTGMVARGAGKKIGHIRQLSEISTGHENVSQPVLLNGAGWPLNAAEYTVLGYGLPEDSPNLEPDPDYTPPPGCVRESTPDGAPLANATAVFLNWDETEGPIAFSGLNFAANM